MTLPPLGKTGAFTAACRAFEHAKGEGNRLFDDPYAQLFTGDVGRSYLEAYAEARAVPLDTAVLGITERTKGIDSAFLNAIKENITQVVMIGCGGDTRAFRMELPKGTQITIYEVDLPEVIAHRNLIFEENGMTPKEGIIVKRLGIDLTNPEWKSSLESIGYNKNKPVLWVIEGILKYFTHSGTLEPLVTDIYSLMAPGSRLLGDVVNTTHVKLSAKPWEAFGGGAMLSGIDDPSNFFSRFGFNEVAVRQVGYPRDEHEKMMSSPICEGDPLRRWFLITAERN
eukprot:TRINITY_DN4591_c0_g1_i1.p1 TRINITY_DN4591_c0_g1~~TRINITY_DN4591_c0_g1_i1.p1  ORF type:complete len:302 (+),score=44.66 TRINITY_DN4591_c0_g1_i1:58-906(+)